MSVRLASFQEGCEVLGDEVRDHGHAHAGFAQGDLGDANSINLYTTSNI